MKQEHTSAKTSRKQIPAIVKQMTKWGVFKQGQFVLDYGGGAYNDTKEYVKEQNDLRYMIFDKYNRPAEHNGVVLAFTMDNGGADVVVLANVLNIIKEYPVRLEVLDQCQNSLKSGGKIYISVYNAKQSDKYKQTDEFVGQPTRDGWQNCQKLSFYVDECKKIFGDNVITKSGFIIVTKE